MSNSEKRLQVTNMVEPIIIANILKAKVGRSKISDFAPILSAISAQWGLNIKKVSDFRIAMRIIYHSSKNN